MARLTVKEVIEQQQKLVEETPALAEDNVVLQGCDCEGYCGSVERDEIKDVFLGRE